MAIQDELTNLSTIQPVTRPRLYGIVETYMRKRLPEDSHSALKALRDRREALTTPPQIPSASEVDAPEESDLAKRETEGDEDLSLEELYSDAEGEKQRFRVALEAYEETAQTSKYKTGIEIDSTHTWEEVLANIETAADSYKSPSGLWGKIRKSFRRFGKTHKAFSAWIGLLPSESEYFSILCGGLKLILGAAARLQDLRDDICEALSEIPILLTSTHRAIGAFQKSKSLHQAAADLYVATLVALNHIVVWYREKALKKFSKTLFKQSSYEQSLSDKIQAIRTSAHHFEVSAQLCSYETISHTDQTLASHSKQWRQAQQTIIGRLDRSRYESSQQNWHLGETLLRESGSMQKAVGTLLNRVETLEETLARFLASNERIVYRTEDVREPMLPLRKVASESRLREERLEARQALLSALDYEHEVLKRDVEAKLRAIWTLPRPEQDRIIAIMRSPKLHRWITATTSSALLVNGNYQGSKWKQPTSFICAKLIDSIQPVTDDTQIFSSTTFHLAYFCGEHLESRDPDSGLDGMMRSLLSQLLLSFPDFDLAIVQRMRDVHYDDLNDLCDLFFALVDQLPRQYVVFCILDGISFYEDDATMCKKASLVLQALVDITERTREDECAFKLLLMSPWNSRALYREMIDQEADVLWTPLRVPALGGFTAAGWNAIVSSHMIVD